MKDVLVDTQALIWFAEGAPQLLATARQLIDDRSIRQFASAASLWEMAIKVALGKMSLKAGSLAAFARLLRTNDIGVLPVGEDDAVAVESLPPGGPHKDPFDRVIAAQCLRMNLTLVSIDAALDRYGVRRIW